MSDDSHDKDESLEVDDSDDSFEDDDSNQMEAGAVPGMPGAPQLGNLLSKLNQLQHDAGETEAEGSAGGGMVIVKVNGRNEVLSVKIEKEIVDPDDIQMLEDLVRAAMNAAARNVQEKMREGLAKMAMGFGMPPGFMGGS